MRRVLVCLICFFVAGCTSYAGLKMESADNFLLIEGTGERTEREFKVGIEGEDFELEEIADEVNQALSQTDRLSNDYRIDEKPEQFVYLDIYFDDDTGLLADTAVSYRLRQRFKNKEKLREVDPFRMEIQAKTNRQELGDGFSTVEETRFEFRDESSPFSVKNPAPKPPWNLDRFIRYAIVGWYKQYPMAPSMTLLNYFQKEEMRVRPSLVVITERERQHLNLRTPWGSGPNPEQVFIVTVDQAQVFDVDAYFEYLQVLEKGWQGIEPSPIGSFSEMEIEFERNVATVLDEKIEAGEESLIKDRDRFLADQKQILEIAKEALPDLELVPASQSKYEQAYSFL